MARERFYFFISYFLRQFFYWIELESTTLKIGIGGFEVYLKSLRL